MAAIRGRAYDSSSDSDSDSSSDDEYERQRRLRRRRRMMMELISQEEARRSHCIHGALGAGPLFIQGRAGLVSTTRTRRTPDSFEQDSSSVLGASIGAGINGVAQINASASMGVHTRVGLDGRNTTYSVGASAGISAGNGMEIIGGGANLGLSVGDAGVSVEAGAGVNIGGLELGVRAGIGSNGPSLGVNVGVGKLITNMLGF